MGYEDQEPTEQVSHLVTVYSNLFSTVLICSSYSMSKTTRKYIEEMGETGAGIRSADDIDMTVQNEFTNKWGASSK